MSRCLLSVWLLRIILFTICIKTAPRVICLTFSLVLLSNIYRRTNRLFMPTVGYDTNKKRKKQNPIQHKFKNSLQPKLCGTRNKKKNLNNNDTRVPE